MRLLEYEGKKLLEKSKIPVPRSYFFKDAGEGEKFLRELGGQAVLKVQVLSGGRGKLGGVKKVDLANYYDVVEEMREISFNNEEIHGFLLEEPLKISKELYLGIVMDTIEGMPLFVGSSGGGVEVESIVKKKDEKKCKYHIDPLKLFLTYHCYGLAGQMGLTGKELVGVSGMIYKLYKAFVNFDCEMAEINPLIITEDGDIYAGDAKFIINDDSMFRQGELKKIIVQEPKNKSYLESEAEKNNIHFLDLDGDVAVVSIGAGLTMTVLDMIKYSGGTPANFIDAKGGADEATIRKMTELVLEKTRQDNKIKCVVITIVLSATQLSSLVLGISSVIKEKGCPVPVLALIYASDAALHEMDYPTAVKTFEDLGIKVFPQMKDMFAYCHNLLKGAIEIGDTN